MLPVGATAGGRGQNELSNAMRGRLDEISRTPKEEKPEDYVICGTKVKPSDKITDGKPTILARLSWGGQCLLLDLRQKAWRGVRMPHN